MHSKVYIPSVEAAKYPIISFQKERFWLTWSAYNFYCSSLNFQRNNCFQPVFELKHSKYLYWCHKCKEIKGSPLHSNWYLLTHLTWGRNVLHRMDYVIGKKKNVVIYHSPSFWKLKEKDKLQNFFFSFSLQCTWLSHPPSAWLRY